MKTFLVVLGVVALGATVTLAGGRYGGARGHGMRRALQQLSPEKEMLVHQTMRKMHDSSTATREQIRTVKTEIKEVIEAETFDEKLFREKVNQLVDLHGAMARVKSNAVAELAPQFTQEERKVLAQFMDRGRRGHLGKGFHSKPE